MTEQADLHVVVVVDSDAFGGAEVYARRLLRHLPAWCRRSLVVSEPVARHFGEPGLVDHLVVVDLHRHRDRAPAVAEAVAALDPDVVHVHLVDPASNLAVLTAAVGVAPTVATLHLQGTPPESAFPAVDYAIAPSATIAEQLRDLGVPEEWVVRVRHGIEIPDAPVEVVDRTPVTIGTVARLTEQKGLDLLLDAVRVLHDEDRALRLVIGGEGRDRESLQERATGLPVTFLGHCDDVPGLLRTLDVFCLPSRREALSLALLEAVAHGLPCVSADVGDTREALEGAVLIVPVDDRPALAAALRRLLDDVELRRTLGATARRRAEADLDVTLMAERTAEVLRRAAFSRAARRRGSVHA